VAQAALALYLLATALAAVVTVVSLLAYGRFGSVSFRHLALIATGALLVLLARFILAWQEAVPETPSVVRTIVVGVLEGAGLGLDGFFVTALCFSVAGRSDRPFLVAMKVVTGAVMAGAGVVQAFAPGPVPDLIVTLGLLGLFVASVAYLSSRRASIAEAQVRSLVRTLGAAAPFLAALVIAQSLLPFVAGPRILVRFPVALLILLLFIESVFVAFSLRYLFRPEPVQACILSATFVSRFGISARECEIISMLIEGYGNRLIGEKLYISPATVKNHVYHIYRKTGARNKVQLVNLVNATK
jgi:DNA-binding CsgD family transcriptional regulator